MKITRYFDRISSCVDNRLIDKFLIERRKKGVKKGLEKERGRMMNGSTVLFVNGTMGKSIHFCYLQSLNGSLIQGSK